ncbi:MAG: hypothetical protein QOJ32_2324 [Frankiaceae bacterium]|jgi:uncharacterized membrane protein|nr:hypothetical protein [Frankiaceae bacterium]MDQ1635515.1 hypothetical protein [Frankiaceae bacterium]MDQ1650484.1 hypothetical protein [Frankiaceae bacterium]MDQ1674303.1 hypothetical protein [Frankiaceae bacterium]
MSLSILGLFAGLLLTIAVAAGGWWFFLLGIVLAVFGFIIGKVLDGELDLSPYLSSRSSRER